MEDLDPCRGECRADHNDQYVLRLAFYLVIRFVMSGDVGAGLPKASYLGAGYRGGSAWGRGSRGGALSGVKCG